MAGASDSHELASRQLALLLAPPTDDDVAAYYASLLAPGRPGHGDVLVKPSSKYQGRGLFAARDFAEGERVLCEPPLVGIQQESNREDATVCAQCFRYVGSIERQIATRLLRDSHREACEGVVEGSEAPELTAAVKEGLLSSDREKLLNTKLNVWCRSPGLTMVAYAIYIGWRQHKPRGY